MPVELWCSFYFGGISEAICTKPRWGRSEAPSRPACVNTQGGRVIQALFLFGSDDSDCSCVQTGKNRPNESHSGAQQVSRGLVPRPSTSQGTLCPTHASPQAPWRQASSATLVIWFDRLSAFPHRSGITWAGAGCVTAAEALLSMPPGSVRPALLSPTGPPGRRCRPLLTDEEARFRRTQGLAQGHVRGHCHSWDSAPGSLDPRLHDFTMGCRKDLILGSRVCRVNVSPGRAARSQQGS